MDTNGCNDNANNANNANVNGSVYYNSNARDYRGACVAVLRVTHVEVLLVAWREVLPCLTLRWKHFFRFWLESIGRDCQCATLQEVALRLARRNC